jgi:uncharacterized protein involved in response to NO
MKPGGQHKSVVKLTLAPASPARPASAKAAAAANAPWRPQWLLAAPHRLGFFAAALVLAASALWWLAVLTLRLVPAAALPWAISPALAHSTLMAFGFMPLFFSGFLFTAGPKWLAQSEVPHGRSFPR